MLKYFQRRLVTDPDEVAKHASMLPQSEMTQLLAATSVPLPQRRFGPAKQRKKAMLQKTAAHTTRHWSRSTPTFRIPGVKIKELADRPKPCKVDKAHSGEVMEEMMDWESNAFSAKFADEDGKLLAAYFSNRIRSTDKPPDATYIGGPHTPSQLGRSVCDLETAQADDNVQLEFDGIPVRASPDLRVSIYS